MPVPRKSAIASIAAGALLALAGPAAAKPAKTACGISYLPLVEGTTWTYEPFESPLPISEEDEAQLKKWAWVSPAAPKKVVIKVTRVEQSAAGATISLEENADGLVRATTLSCTKDGLEIDPQSFFFAIEPGGAVLMELSDIKRTGSLPGAKGWKKADKSVVTVSAKLARTSTEGTGAAMTGGVVELERTVYPGAVESVQTPAGKHDKVQRIEFDLAGRVAVEPNMDKRIEIPLRWRGIMWFRDGVGLVQARNRIGHWFQLTEYTLGGAE